ncbi:hypothetical protein JOQ06_025104, partial [Pogonophryne albipinna]
MTAGLWRGSPVSQAHTERAGPAICSKVNGKETRWRGEMCPYSPERQGERDGQRVE